MLQTHHTADKAVTVPATHNACQPTTLPSPVEGTALRSHILHELSPPPPWPQLIRSRVDTSFENSPAWGNKTRWGPLDSPFGVESDYGQSHLGSPKLRAQQRYSKHAPRHCWGSVEVTQGLMSGGGAAWVGGAKPAPSSPRAVPPSPALHERCCLKKGFHCSACLQITGRRKNIGPEKVKEAG